MNEELLKDYEKLIVNHLLRKADSTFISHEEIEELVLLKRGTSQYYSFMRRVEGQLLYHSKGLKSVKGKGYTLLGAEAIIDKALKIAQSSEKRTFEALKLINEIDKDELNEEYKMKYDIIQLKFVQMNSSLSGQIREISLLASPNKKRLSEVRK